jgi:predicted ribosomally synthesized peptide with nif11-like leader
MKTLGEFLQRLEDDAAFEKKAQAFNNGDELMAFVKGEGYDFTLEHLTCAFQQRADLPPQAQVTAPAPPDVSASIPPGPEVTPFPVSPAASPQDAASTVSAVKGSADFPREPARQEQQKSPEAIPRKDLEEKAGGLFKGGGGRHRGFSPERLKSVSEEDS